MPCSVCPCAKSQHPTRNVTSMNSRRAPQGRAVCRSAPPPGSEACTAPLGIPTALRRAPKATRHRQPASRSRRSERAFARGLRGALEEQVVPLAAAPIAEGRAVTKVTFSTTAYSICPPHTISDVSREQWQHSRRHQLLHSPSTPGHHLGYDSRESRSISSNLAPDAVEPGALEVDALLRAAVCVGREGEEAALVAGPLLP